MSATTYTLRVLDLGARLRCANPDGTNLVIPTTATQAIPVRTEFEVWREAGAGPVVLQPAIGVTVNGPPGCTFTIASESAGARLVKVADAEWDWEELVGNPTSIGGVTVESGEGAPTHERAVGSLWIRTDVSQLWRRVEPTVLDTSAVNIVGTNLANPTNVVTLSGYTTDQWLRFSKPLAAASGGLLTWDAFSAWASDGSTTPVPPPVVGRTWNNAVSIYGNNGGSDVLLFAAALDADLYLTEADAYAALAAQVPVTFTGYATYKIVGPDDPNPPDNRNGLSILVEEVTPVWILMSDLTSIRQDGVEIEDSPRSLDFVSANLVLEATTDADGHVTVTLNDDADPTMAANSDARVPTQAAVVAKIAAAIAGLSWKQRVRAATTANITLSGAQTIDGVSVIAGDRVLVKDQSTASQNGLYDAASGSWTRTTDADSGAELVNASVYVSEGTVNEDTQWTCSTNAPITVGSTSLAFAQFTSGGGAGLWIDVTPPSDPVAYPFWWDCTASATGGRLKIYYNDGTSSQWVDATPALPGATGPAAWAPSVAWATATAYVAGPPASVVTKDGSSYVCLISHTSGTFATDLAAAKWLVLAAAGTNGSNGSAGATGGTQAIDFALHALCGGI